MSAIIVDSYRNITCASTKTCSIICAMSDELSWLQQWYSAHCDGEWEHGFGVTIATLDNPGWSVTIDVEGTQLASTPFESVKTASRRQAGPLPRDGTEREGAWSSIRFRPPV